MIAKKLFRDKEVLVFLTFYKKTKNVDYSSRTIYHDFLIQIRHKTI